MDQFGDSCVQCILSGEMLEIWYCQTETLDHGTLPVQSKLQGRIAHRQEG